MPTNRRYKRQARRASYPDWLLTALRDGRSDHGLEVALYALRHNAEIVVARNREPDHRLTVEVVKTIWREYGETLLADHVEAYPGTRPVCWFWWDQEVVRIKPGSTIEEVEARIGDQGSWLLDNGFLEPSEVE